MQDTADWARVRFLAYWLVLMVADWVARSSWRSASFSSSTGGDRRRPRGEAAAWGRPRRQPARWCQGLAACRAAISQGVSQVTPAGVRCTPSLRTVMPSTVAV